MVEVAALIVTAWLLDAHVLALLPEHRDMWGLAPPTAHAT